MILVIAGALDLDGSAVQEKTLLRVEGERADTEGDPLRVVHSIRGRDRNNREVLVRVFRRPESWRGQAGGGGECRLAAWGDALRLALSGGDRSAHCIQDLPMNTGVRVCELLILDDGGE